MIRKSNLALIMLVTLASTESGEREGCTFHDLCGDGV